MALVAVFLVGAFFAGDFFAVFLAAPVLLVAVFLAAPVLLVAVFLAAPVLFGSRCLLGGAGALGGGLLRR